jgi:hypothetical protein
MPAELDACVFESFLNGGDVYNESHRQFTPKLEIWRGDMHGTFG